MQSGFHEEYLTDVTTCSAGAILSVTIRLNTPYKPPQFIYHVTHGLIAFLQVFHTSENDVVKRFESFRRRAWNSLFICKFDDKITRILIDVFRVSTVQHFVADDAERINIGTDVKAFRIVYLFGRKVPLRTDDDAVEFIVVGSNPPDRTEIT